MKKCTTKTLCNKKDCKICYNRSFESHEKSKHWNHDLNEKTPRQVFKIVCKKYWFKCDKCNHNFNSFLNNIVSKGRWCPYCSNQKLCFKKECKICFNKSAQSLEKIKNWNYKLNKKHPRLIFKYSAPKRWFNCENCNHNFDITLNIIKKSWCPYCSSKKLCNKKECVHCFNKSFQSSDKIQFWDIKINNQIPRFVFKFSGKKYWFNCEKCNNSFNIKLTDIFQGKWCPVCKNKTEKKLLYYLKDKFDNVKFQKKFKWCKNKTYLPFDFVINKIIISLDGNQHFKEVKHWKNDIKEQQERDNYKMKCALENGYSVIRVFQEWVWKDKNNWKDFLHNAINFCEKNENFIIIQEETEELYKNHFVENFKKITI